MRNTIPDVNDRQHSNIRDDQ